MSRTQAAGKINRRTGKSITRGVINWPKWQYQLKQRGVELRGGGADEAPECYKDLKEVLAAHAGTINVLHTLRPIGVAMAGKDTFDPYRD
jgi:tRNA-splicing ligase RtcB